GGWGREELGGAGGLGAGGLDAVPGEAEQRLSLPDDVVDGRGGDCEQAGQDRPGQREAQGEQGDRGPVAESEDGLAPGPGGDPPGAAAPPVQGPFTPGVAGGAPGDVAFEPPPGRHTRPR